MEQAYSFINCFLNLFSGKHISLFSFRHISEYWIAFLLLVFQFFLSKEHQIFLQMLEQRNCHVLCLFERFADTWQFYNVCSANDFLFLTCYPRFGSQLHLLVSSWLSSLHGPPCKVSFKEGRHGRLKYQWCHNQECSTISLDIYFKVIKFQVCLIYIMNRKLISWISRTI